MKARVVDILSSVLLMIALPPLTYYIWVCVNDFGGALIFPKTEFLSSIPAPTITSVVLYGCWLLLQTLLQIAAPGKTHEGLPLSDGTRLKYKMNGWFSFWFTMSVALLAAGIGWIPATIFYDQFGPLLTTANLFAFAF